MLLRDAGSAGATRNGLPWPEGNPGALDDAAHGAAQAAHTVRAGAARVDAAAAAASGWQGQAAEAFRGAVAQERAQMHRGAAGLEHAAGALRRLAGVLEQAQALVTRLAAEVEEAEDEARRASQRAAAYGLIAEAASFRLMLGGADPSPSLQSAADNASADASAAQTLAGNAQAHANEVRERNTRRAQEACDDVLREDASTAAAVNDAASAAPLSGVRAGVPTPAQRFGQVALSGLTLEQWHAIAYWRAGIDGDAWDPSAGLLANDDIVQAVYRYYGDLFIAHPELQWSGMAALVGPMFYGGWQDIYTVRQISDPGERASYLATLAGLPRLPGIVEDGVDLAGHLPGGFLNPADLAQHLTEDELEYFETTFLGMQREIFDDLAWKHEAYTLGGAGLMHELDRQLLLEPGEIDAWDAIASGDSASVQQGNEQLLRREQHDIIQSRYDEMRNHHGPVGDVFTYTTTVMADDPIPGGRPYRDVYPLHVGFDIPTPQAPFTDWPRRPHVDITTPLPDGNISNYDDRWNWIQSDMLPRYRELLAQPGATQAIVSQDVAARAEEWRHLPDLPYPGG